VEVVDSEMGLTRLPSGENNVVDLCSAGVRMQKHSLRI